jgi:hypothetical protein
MFVHPYYNHWRTNYCDCNWYFRQWFISHRKFCCRNQSSQRQDEWEIYLDRSRMIGILIRSWTLLLHQTACRKKILNNFNMSECNSVKTPLPQDLNLSLMDSPEEVDPKLHSMYRAIVRALMYLYQWTRPDLGFTVRFLSRYLHKPGEKHLLAAKHVLRYLKGTIDLGIRYTLKRSSTTSRKGSTIECVVHVVRQWFCRMQGYILFHVRLYDFDEWWGCCILFWKAVNCGSVHSYGWNKHAC